MCGFKQMSSVGVYQGVRLMQVKNPWSHLRWKGNYSELDMQHWTEEMKSLLNYDPESASTYDNGMLLWIEMVFIGRIFFEELMFYKLTRIKH